MGCYFATKKPIDIQRFSGRIDGKKLELFDMYQNGITLPVCMGDAMYIG